MVIRTLNRKLIRDLLSLKAQVSTTAVLVISGVSLLIASWSAYRSLKSSHDSYYREFAFADVFSDVKRAPVEILRAIAKIPDVERAEGRIVMDGLVDLGRREPAVGRFISVPSGAQPILNRLYLRQGRLPSEAQVVEVAVHEGFAKANGIHLGDRLSVLIQGQKEPVQVVGIALSPEYVYALSPAAPLPDDRYFGVIWMPSEPLKRLSKIGDAINSVSITLWPGDSSGEDRLKARVDEILKPFGSRGSYGRDMQPSSRFVSDEIAQQRGSAILTPAIFLSVAAFLIQIISSRLIAMHRPQIATLKAIGYTDFEVSEHYFSLILAMMLVGAIPGIGLGALLGQLVAKSYENFFRFPSLDFSLSASSAALGLVAGILPGLLGAWGSIRAAFRLPPAEAMRPPSPPAFHEGILERFGLERRFRIRQRMIWRSLFFKPLRLALSTLGMATALAVVIASVAWNDIVKFLLDTQFQTVQREDLSVTLVQPLPLGGLQELSRMKGVLDVEGYRVAPVRVRYRNYKRELVVTGWPAEARMRLRLDTDLNPIPLPGEGILLSQFFRKSWHLSVGSEVELETMEGSPRKERVPVSGFTGDLVGISASMDMRALWRILGEEPDYNLATLKIDPRQSEQLYVALKNAPEVATVNFKESLYRGFQESMGTMIRVTTWILTGFALAIALGVIYNSIRVTFSERSWEMASLRVLGFSKSETFGMLLTEVGTQVALSLVPGCLLGWGLTHFVLKGVNTETFGFPIIIEPSTYATGVLVVLIAFAISAMIIRGMISSLSLAEALKARE